MKLLQLDYAKKTTTLLTMVVGFVIMLLQWIIGTNLITIVAIAYCLILTLFIFLGIMIKKKLYLFFALGYFFSIFGIITFYIFNGADAGFGALTTANSGFSSIAHPLLTGSGNFWTRLFGNSLLILPSIVVVYLIFYTYKRIYKNRKLQLALVASLSVVLMISTLVYFFTMNLRATPKCFDLSKGHDEYLNGVGTADKNSPNVLIIMMDDLGYGDTSHNGAIFNTPNIDSIAENGVNMENFYSSYSVCSPARFAALTGRYPYRGYADNVLFPTVSSFDPYASTRVFNGIEMGNNVDGMLGDEITIAEVFRSADYNTGAFGKWHLGDYGQYLPTNQGFDYFYGSHHVNDMNPFYYVEEQNGQYEITVGANELNQNNATKIIHNEISSWIGDAAKDDKPFFAYYATPWPHAPIYAGEDYQGSTGMGIYADCVTEFDAYLGILFDEMRGLGVFDDTIILFTSDNGPALQGSTNELRGAKYMPYEGGQKVPFYMQWNNSQSIITKGATISSPATFTDLFPSLIDLCQIKDKNGNSNYLPFDRDMDGVSIMPSLLDKTNNIVLHTSSNPLLYMKREKIQAVSYSVSTKYMLDQTSAYIATDRHAEGSAYENYTFLQGESYVTFKYFKNMQNDNPAFFDKRRKNWLIMLTDDSGENYNRNEVFPDMALEMRNTLDYWTKTLKSNRRGVNWDYYNV